MGKHLSEGLDQLLAQPFGRDDRVNESLIGGAGENLTRDARAAEAGEDRERVL